MNFRITSEPTALEAARCDALLVLSALDPIMDKDHYDLVLKNVKTLSKLIAAEQREKLSPNTLLIALANLVIVLKVVKYEETNIINSKVIPFLMRKI